MQARRRAQPSGTNSPSSSHPRWKAPSAMRDLLSVPAMRPPGSPRCGDLAGSIQRAAGERPPRARPQRRGSPGPIPNPAVKPAFAESTAAQGCGRAGRRARGGRFSIARAAERPAGPAGDPVPRGPFLRLWACARGPPSALGGMLRAAYSAFRGRRFLHAGPFLVQGGACSFGCSLHLQGTSPECDLRTLLECETRSRGSSCFLAGCELALFAAVGGCVAPCFIVTHNASHLLFVRPASMEYLVLS